MDDVQTEVRSMMALRPAFSIGVRFSKAKSRLVVILQIMIILAGFCGRTYAQTGQVYGKIEDATDGSSLPGANILLKGTAQGTTSDLYGKYSFTNLSPGEHELVFRYIGYQEQTVRVRVASGDRLELNIKMEPQAIKGKEVLVTGQLRGQNAAINQQVNSNTIVNVISKERIQELPDQNAAETISRLPGISIQRSGGEGQKVIIRGLDPKFTNITVNGVKIPSLDPVDRSVDLSSVSSDMLGGVEVYKSFTADQDGDAVGGTVNFEMKRAPDSISAQVRGQGGYNALQKDYRNYRTSVSLSDRFFKNSLGLVVTGSAERADRSSDELSANYATPRPFTVSPKLYDTYDIRDRYGASLEADMNVGEGNLYLTGFWSQLSHNPIELEKRFKPTTGNVGDFEYSDGQTTNQLAVLSLSGNHPLILPSVGVLVLDWGISGTQSEQLTPLQLGARFYQNGVNGVNTNSGPDSVFATWKINPDTTYLQQITADSIKVLDKNLVFQLNGKFDLDFGKGVFGRVKFGGKYKTKSRVRFNSELWTNNYLNTSVPGVVRYYQNHPDEVNPFSVYRLTGNKISMDNFISSNDQVGEFLDGRFAGWPSLDQYALHAFYNAFKNYSDPRGGVSQQMFVYNPIVSAESYSASEHISAGYIETQLNFGDRLMILPGVRYERTYNDYKSTFGSISIGENEVPTLSGAKDTIGTSTFEDWLPTVNVRYVPLKGVIIRGSLTKTLSRPDFFDLVPYQQIGSDNTIYQGNPTLKHVTSHNYDAGFSVNNQYGLFSADYFHKDLYNVMYPAALIVTAGTSRTNPYYGWTLYQTVNAAGVSSVDGVELELQANFLMLPSPFNGIILNGNISFMKSKTVVPFIDINNPADTTRAVAMPGQSDEIANLTLGYERWGFSGRISVIYQGKSLYAVGQASDLDSYTAPYYRWDLSMQQKLFAGFSIYFNLYNITNVRDMSYLGTESLPTSIQEYGMTANLGIQYLLR